MLWDKDFALQGIKTDGTVIILRFTADDINHMMKTHRCLRRKADCSAWKSQQLGVGQCRVRQCFIELILFHSLAVAGHCVIFTGIQFFIFKLLKRNYF